MYYKLAKQSFLQAVSITILILAILNITSAEVRSSSNYKIQSDSINVGGGLSSSTNYVQESTGGEISTGVSDSDNYSLRAGYQQMQEVFLSLAVEGDVTMSPALGGLTGGTSNGSTTLTVITDSPSGYQLTVAAENNPAMQSGANSIADYDAGVATDATFSVAGGEAFFGFTPEGLDVVDEFRDDGLGVCGSGILDTSLTCWDGLSTSDTPVAIGSGSNHPVGATTTLNFRVGIGSGSAVISGLYTATTTVTALPL